MNLTKITDIFLPVLMLLISADAASGAVTASTDYNTLREVLGLGLRVVEVMTEDNAEPTCDYVSAPPGSWGSGITNAVKVPGMVTVYETDGTVAFSSGIYSKGTSGMTIKVRGNTSAYADKKPFKIKLQKKGDMLTRGDKNFNDKNWVLLSDPQMKIYLGFMMSELVGQPWSPAGEFVNLIINGDFRGLYLLAEGVERNEKCRVDVSDSGFIVEHDPYWWNEDGEYVSSADSPQYNYTFKYPDFEDMTPERINKISAVLALYEASVADGTYPDYIDVDSFARWMLAHDILGTIDGAGVNFYLTKYEDSPHSLIQTGPLWDFDSSERADNAWSNVHTGRFSRFFNNGNPTFLEAYVDNWNELKDVIFSGISENLENLMADNGEGYDASVAADNRRWNYIYSSTLEEVRLRAGRWYSSRRPWLERNIPLLNANVSVGEVTAGPRTPSFRVEGRELKLEDYRGEISIYTPDGKSLFAGRNVSSFTFPAPGLYIVSTPMGHDKIMVR